MQVQSRAEVTSHTSFGSRTSGGNLRNSLFSRQQVKIAEATLITAWKSAADGFCYFHRPLAPSAHVVCASRTVVTPSTEYLTTKWRKELQKMYCSLLQRTLSR